MKSTYTYTLILLSIALLLVGCRSQQEYAYLHDAPRDSTVPITHTYGSTIDIDDLLYIYVYSQFQNAAFPFNQETNRERGSNLPIPGYRVSNEGNITFPVIGTLHVAGLTTVELEQKIAQTLIDSQLVLDPVVSISPMNFNVTVIGEVRRPNLLTGSGNRMTIFEALAMCGDITMDGLRTNVKIIRRSNGQEIIDTIDLTSRKLLESPYYYLQSGDIIYVEPTERKKKIAYRDEDWPLYITTGASALRFAYVLVYRYFISPQFKRYLND